MRKKRYYFYFLILILIFLLSRELIRSNSVRANGLDNWPPTEILHPWASDINPAIISSQNARISLGHRVFHLGFLPGNSLGIRESQINVSFPFYLPFRLGAGIDTRYYAAGLYTEFIGSMLFSRQIFNQFSLGIKLGLEQRIFARDNFVLVDANDPVLMGQLSHTNFNLGLGLFWTPGNWSVGMGLNHLNRPNIAHQSQAILAPELSGAIGYNFGIIKPTILIHDEGEGLQFGFSLLTTHPDLGFLRFAFAPDTPIKVEACFNLSRNTSLQYDYDFAGEMTRAVTSGCHELVFNYTFSREPDIARPDIFFSTEKVEIVKETVVRQMAADLVAEDLVELEELAAEYLDPNRKPQDLLIIAAGILNQFETATIKNQRYAWLAEEIKQALQQNPDLKLVIRIEPGSKADAITFKEHLVHHKIIPVEKIYVGRLNTSEAPVLTGFVPGKKILSTKLPCFSVDKLSIRFAVAGKTTRVKTWKFTLMNCHGAIIRTFEGEGTLPDGLEWDWKNNSGATITAGQYGGILLLQTVSGKTIESRSPQLQVNQVTRNKVIRFESRSLRQTIRDKAISKIAGTF